MLKIKFACENAECTNEVSIMHGENRRFTLRLVEVIYHWADIMASRCSHIGITEAGTWPAD